MQDLSAFAAFASGTATEDVPPEVRAKTALILADCIGAIVGGAAEPEMAALRDRLVSSSPGPVAVIGSGRTASPGVAALLNGTAGTTLEMDEGNQFCKGHPAMHVVPAALAHAAGQPVSGRDLLAALAIGYEAAARVGIGTALRPSMHPHGTWGAIGAAVAVQRLARADADAIRQAMNMAANLGLTTSRRTMLEGGTVRNVFAGVSNQMGLLAADLAASGYSGDRDGVGWVFGHVASDRFDPAALTEDLGRRWEVMRNYFKMHSCCRYNHATLDALARLTAEHPGVTVDDIEKVEVDTYALAVELDDPAPRNVLAAKFSVPFAVATALVTGSTGVASFTEDEVGDPAILALASRVEVREDPAMSAKLPGLRPARVTVVLRSGQRLAAETETNRGDWADPYPPAEIREKYLSLATRGWSIDHAARVWDEIHALDTSPDAGALLALLAE